MNIANGNSEKAQPIRFITDPALSSISYPDLFRRFTANTDSKQVIARGVAEIARGIPAHSLLDLGAGDGVVTELLSKEIPSVVAVERKEKFCRENLSKLSGVTVKNCTMQDFAAAERDRSAGTYDLILLSYSLSGVSPQEMPQFIEGLTQLRSPNGKIILVSFEDRCPWDCFASEVYSLLDIPRSGGAQNYQRLFQSLGIKLAHRATHPSYMWGSSIAELVELTEFFFASKAEAFRERREEIATILRPFTETLFDGRVALRADEGIYEIAPRWLTEVAIRFRP